MLSLVTPGTGYLDLEARLAFGLVRLAVETWRRGSLINQGTTGRVDLIPEPGRYRLQFEGSAARLNDALRLQATRHYATEAPFRLPGIQARYRANFRTVEKGAIKAAYHDADLAALYAQAHAGDRHPWSRHQCGHAQLEPFGGTSGLILATSAHAGMPARRDSVSGGNLRLCAVCGLLVVIGIHAAALRHTLQSGGERLTLLTTLLPQRPLPHDDLLELLALQKAVDQRRLCGIIPIQTAPLAILSHFPHLAQVLARTAMLFHLALFSPGRTDRLNATAVVDASRLARFIDASPFHVASVEALIARRANPAVEPLVELTRALTMEGLPGRRRAAGLFARSYAGDRLRERAGGRAPIANQPRLLYRTTGRYLAEEVCMIPRHIIEHEAVSAVADLLRYFVVHRHYGYVDAIRNARPASHDFERALTAMLRECRARRDPETGRDDCPRQHFVPLPDEGHLRDVVRLAQESFEEVKLALALLGLSRREWEEAPAVALAEEAAEGAAVQEGEA
jgi:CRISPR type I-A-associated protein Csa5